jgi:hypothetical protein
MAAGLGFKTFTTGEVLTSADVNGYLMQGVLVFASEAARDAAITSPQEGQFAFTKDNNSLWYYTGSVWAASGATGDIEGVTAGTGISGGGTSGTVTITNSMATEIDAKGDLVVGTGADTFARLAVGTDGYTLVADSVETTGLKWAAPAAGGGKVLQVVSGTTSTSTTTTSTTWADTTLTATITPSAATSKILILTNQVFTQSRSSNNSEIGFRLLRGSTQIHGSTAASAPTGSLFQATGSTFVQVNSYFDFSFVDSPNTTSATTYKTQQAVETTANSSQVISQYNSQVSSIVLLEIGA